jgi:hypothetical protein
MSNNVVSSNIGVMSSNTDLSNIITPNKYNAIPAGNDSLHSALHDALKYKSALLILALSFVLMIVFIFMLISKNTAIATCQTDLATKEILIANLQKHSNLEQISGLWQDRDNSLALDMQIFYSQNAIKVFTPDAKSTYYTFVYDESMKSFNNNVTNGNTIAIITWDGQDSILVTVFSSRSTTADKTLTWNRKITIEGKIS